LSAFVFIDSSSFVHIVGYLFERTGNLKFERKIHPNKDIVTIIGDVRDVFFPCTNKVMVTEAVSPSHPHLPLELTNGKCVARMMKQLLNSLF